MDSGDNGKRCGVGKSDNRTADMHASLRHLRYVVVFLHESKSKGS